MAPWEKKKRAQEYIQVYIAICLMIKMLLEASEKEQIGF